MNVLPALVSARDPEGAMLQAPGGFTWWYADLVDGAGNGFVLIVAFGLPFLPGYAQAARAGRPQRPIERPAVVVAAVEGGRPWFWSVTELDQTAISWTDGDIRTSLGRIRWSSSTAGSPSAPFEFDADLHGSLGGCEWTAGLQVRGHSRAPGAGEPAHAAHEWNVLGVGEGRATLRAGGRALTVTGRAYVDRNASDAPLHEADSPWCWGRLALPGRDLVWYAADRDGRTVSIDRDATSIGPRPQITTWRVGRWGQWVPAAIALEGGGVSLRPFDDSPFYTRFLAEGTVRGERAYGMAEWCVPARIDAGWIRPLVRMAVPPANALGSRWLPLLAGPAHGRIARTARRWWP